MQEYSDQIVVSEAGAFIPKKLFGRREQIVNELDQAGVFAPPPPEKPKPKIRRVPMVDISRETQWVKEHRHEYVRSVGGAGWRPVDQSRLECPRSGRHRARCRCQGTVFNPH